MAINDLYNDHEHRLDTVMGVASFWAAMRQCRDGEGREHCKSSRLMHQWFLETYGIELQMSADEMYLVDPEVRIVDEAKYLMFLLKYAQ